MGSTITFTKVRDVKSPSQAYSFPAGTDLFIPEYSPGFRDDLIAKNPNKSDYLLSVSPDLLTMSITLMPHGRINIPSGIKVDIEDKNTCLLVANKSGVASKKGLDHLAELIDSDYHGEIHINIYNTGSDPVTVTTGEKITQLMNLPIIYPTWKEVSNSEFDLYSSTTDRGSNGFGSSGS
jgi:dUTP pyrophosphatase